MRLFQILLFFILFHFAFISFISAQTTWDKQTLEKANTAKDAAYLNKEEKLVLFYCNLVRLDPQLFATTYAKKYIDSVGQTDGYTKSLLKTLKTTKAMEALLPSEKLFEFARTHATDFGKKGKVGHGNFKKRFAKYSASCTCDIAENCEYGPDKAFDIVMALLVDENVSDLGHRKNILNPEYKNCDTAIRPHKKFRWNCVMDFSSDSKIQ